MSDKPSTKEEFDSLETLFQAMYRAVSGPERGLDAELERRVFTPEARLIRTGVDEEGRPWRKIMTLDEYEADVQDFLDSNDFYEYETKREVWHCRPFAYVLSEYEAKSDLSSDEVWFSGVNSAQCFFDGTRWWINQMMWNQRR